MRSSLLDRFTASVRLWPDAVAIRCGKARVTYAELDRIATDVELRLHALGAAAGDRVAVLAPAGVAAVAGYLGALRCGASYVPIDPAYPFQRVEQMLEASGAALYVEEDRAGAPVVGMTGYARTEPTPGLVYVVFTSGTTGTPKGVMVEDRSVINLIDDFDDRAPAAGRFTWWTSPSFDVTAWEVWAALANGHELVVPAPQERNDGLALAAFLHDQGIASAFVPASFLPELLHRPSRHLTRLLVGVEPIPMVLLSELLEAFPRLRIINGYGPAELTVCCMAYDVPRDVQRRRGRTPIGRPIRDTHVMLVHPITGDPTEGTEGELWFTGPGIARGYLGRPDTDGRFVRPEWDVLGRRWYRTGDLAHRDADGELIFDGRADRQVKIRGYRVELADVESSLAGHPSVTDAVVTTRLDRHGSEVLAAAVTVQDGTTTGELRDHVVSELPRHAVPAAIAVLDRLPCTASGKLDRDELERVFSELDQARNGGDAFARILQEQGVSDVADPELTFSQLGGTSLGAVSVAAALRDLGHSVSTYQVMTVPIRRLRHLSGTAVPASSSDRTIAFTRTVRGVWVDELRSPGTLTYVETMRFRVDGLDAAALVSAVESVAASYPLLSAGVHRTPGYEPHFVLPDRPDPLCAVIGPIHDSLPRLAAKVAGLTSGPLFAVLVEPQESGVTCVLLWHHAVCDAATADMFLRDLEAVARGETPPHRPVASWPESDQTEAARELVARQSPLPSAIRWPITSGGSPTDLRWCQHDLDLAGRRALLRPGVGRPLTRILWGLGQALRAQYSLDSALVLLAISARVTPEQDSAIGCLINMVPVMVVPTESMDRLSVRVEEAIASADVPFSTVHQVLRRTPQICVSWQEEPTLDLWPVARASYLPTPDLAPKADLVLSGAHHSGQVACMLQGRASVFEDDALEELFTAFRTAVEKTPVTVPAPHARTPRVRL